MVLGEAFHRQVANRLAERLEKEEKHATLLFNPENIRYVTGLALSPTDRPVAACVWSDRRVALFVPQLDAEYAATGSIRDIRWYAEFPSDTSPIDWMAREAGGPLVIDELPASAWATVKEEVEETEIADYVAELRLIKSQPEIDLIKRAADFADLALERIFARLTSGSSERDALHEILSVVDTIMRSELGDLYDPLSRPISGTLRSGTRAAFPLAATSARNLSRSDTVVVEFTASVAGYHAKSGATFFVGDPLRDVVRWVEASMRAQDAAREAMIPGATAESVDQAARKVIERLGFGGMIRHRTGHGIGLAVREAPWLVRSQTTELQPGMVLVNQPGVYVTGRTGGHNCETIVIEEDGPRVLNPRIDRWSTPEARLKEF
ncbi:MAG TPA: Xaa-Pro peptidase family protein [Nitrolancea sp.]|nr:Xaa-Pro peptidase family protein [Nitrolancea sp.]